MCTEQNSYWDDGHVCSVVGETTTRQLFNSLL